MQFKSYAGGYTVVQFVLYVLAVLLGNVVGAVADIPGAAAFYLLFI